MTGENQVRANLERIRIWLEREVPSLAASLQPGLSREQMLEIMGPKGAKYHLPQEVVDLYAWCNGQAEQVPFFGVLRFQPFEEAVDYGNVVEEYFDGEFPLMVFQELGYDAGYQFRCSSKEEKQTPAYRWEHGDAMVETSSLAELLSAVSEGFESGVFRLNDSGELDTDEKAWNSILIRHHPERNSSVNALLRRRWTELSPEQLRDAFFDLVRTNHAEAPALVREYLSANPDLPEQDFEVFYAVLSAGITIKYDWARDFALSLILDQRSNARRAALSFLAWMWHDKLPLTSQYIDSLINQIMISPRSDSDNRERAMLLGIAGDLRAVPALLRLLDNSAADCGSRDTWIAALNSLGRLNAIKARRVCLSIAESDSDTGTRIAAIRALVSIGFDDSRAEAVAKAFYRQMHRQSGGILEQNETPVLKVWREYPSETDL